MRKLSRSSILFIIVGLGLLAFTLIKNPGLFDFQDTEKARSFYRSAREYQKNGEYKNAFYSYAKISPGYAAYDAVLFYQGKCAAELQDEKTAVLKFKKLLSNYSGSPLAPQTSYNLGQAYIRTGNYEEAEKIFKETIKKYHETDFAVGSFYYLGEIENKAGNKQVAEQYWLKYLDEAPSGRFAADCYEGLKNLSYKLSDIQKREIATALFTAEKYSKSLFYLKQIPLKYSWYYLSKNYDELGYKNKALYFCKEGLKKSSASYEKRENFENAMQYYVSSSPKEADKAWDEVLSFTGTARDFALFHKAQLQPRKDALKYYLEIINKYPNGNFASEALWNIFWDSYLKNNYDSALKLAQYHMEKYENTKASPAVHFWMGKIYEKKGKKSEAFKYYQTVLSKYPDSYYAFRAFGRITALKTGNDPGWKTNSNNRIPEDITEVKLPYSNMEIYRKYGPQALELINVGDYETVSSFLNKDDAFLKSWIDLQNGIISKSMVIARNETDKLLVKPDINDSKWKLVYPVYYPENINQNASLNGLDPAIVLSLMKEESYFNTFALSYSNARGLMQLLPETAKYIANKEQLGSYGSVQLFDPEVNIKLGTAYLNHTKKSLNNNMLFAVAAYNAGPYAVQRWIDSSSGRDLDEFTENIPYKQTNDYVKKVYKTYWNYKKIYNLK